MPPRRAREARSAPHNPKRDDKARLYSAKEDYKAIQQRVKQDAEESRCTVLELLNPKALRPDSPWQPLVLNKTAVFYKVVAARGAELVSVYDGTTKYALGRWTHAKHGAASWPPLYACFYAHVSPQQALSTNFPVHSSLSNSAKVLVEMEAKGCAYHHAESDTWCLSRVKLLSILTQTSDLPHGRKSEEVLLHMAREVDLRATSPERLAEVHSMVEPSTNMRSPGRPWLVDGEGGGRSPSGSPRRVNAGNVTGPRISDSGGSARSPTRSRSTDGGARGARPPERSMLTLDGRDVIFSTPDQQGQTARRLLQPIPGPASSILRPQLGVKGLSLLGMKNDVQSRRVSPQDDRREAAIAPAPYSNMVGGIAWNLRGCAEPAHPKSQKKLHPGPPKPPFSPAHVRAHH